MRRLVVLAALALSGALLVGCYKAPPEAMTLEGGRLTIANHSKTDWSNVDVWLNTYYHAGFKSIPAGGRMQAPLDFFVAGLGQRFSYAHMQVHTLRLTAKLPDGSPVEVKKEFEGDAFFALSKSVGKKR